MLLSWLGRSDEPIWLTLLKPCFTGESATERSSALPRAPQLAGRANCKRNAEVRISDAGFLLKGAPYSPSLLRRSFHIKQVAGFRLLRKAFGIKGFVKGSLSPCSFHREVRLESLVGGPQGGDSPGCSGAQQGGQRTERERTRGGIQSHRWSE